MAETTGRRGGYSDECADDADDDEMCKKDTCRKLPGVSVRLDSDSCEQPCKMRCPPGSGLTDCQPLNKKKDCSKYHTFAAIRLTQRSVYIFIQMPYLLFTPSLSYHVATDKVPAQNGDKFRTIFSNNLQPIATRGKKARGTLLVDKHCGNGCSIKRAPLAVSYYNEISGGHIGRAVVRTRCSACPVLPLLRHSELIGRAGMSERRVSLCAASVSWEVWEPVSKAVACCSSYHVFLSEALFRLSSPQNEKVHKRKKFELINIISLECHRVAKQTP